MFLRYKKESITEGILALALFGIIFAVGWTLTTMLVNLIFSIDWFEKWYWQNIDSWFLLLLRKELNRDTISLILLTVAEAIFFYLFFLHGNRKKAGKVRK